MIFRIIWYHVVYNPNKMLVLNIQFKIRMLRMF